MTNMITYTHTEVVLNEGGCVPGLMTDVRVLPYRHKMQVLPVLVFEVDV